jgi:hypothetical protein
MGKRKTITSKTEWLNGKIHVVVMKENKSTKDCMVYSKRQVKGGRQETIIYCENPVYILDVCQKNATH